jgi:hypothetical protein
MNRLTPFSRLLLVVALVVGIFFAIKYFFPNIGSKTELPTTETTTTSQSLPQSNTTAPTAPSSSTTPQSGSSNNPANSEQRKTFGYTAPVPNGGKMKGVVELGASGFNSFIINIDAEKNWELKKAEFGNSLVMEKMATDDDIRIGLKSYIGKMLDFGVAPNNIHFVVSSGALKSDVTPKIIKVLESMKYVVNEVTPAQEGKLGLKCVLPKSYDANSFVADIGSGNTKISWTADGTPFSVETEGAKYFQANKTDDAVYALVRTAANKVPSAKRTTCFIIGGVPFDMAKKVRTGKERYTILNAPSAYKMEDAKGKAGVNIYKAIADATGCQQFVFDWDANFTIGFLLGLK